jgi:uncharacterized protein YukE
MSDGDSFMVHPQALQQYANTVRTQAEAMRRIHSTLAGLNVGGEAFGKLPNSHTMFSEYQSHAQAEAENTSQMAEMLDQVAEALADTAKEYEAVDAHHAGEMQSIAAGTGGN